MPSICLLAVADRNADNYSRHYGFLMSQIGMEPPGRADRGEG